MKPIVLAASAAAFLAALPAPAHAGSIYFDIPMTNACIDAVAFQDASNRTMYQCTKALTQEASLRPHHQSAVLVNRGILRGLAEDRAGALHDFREAAALDPAQPEAWLGLAIEQWKAGDIGGAHGSADRAIALGTAKPAVAYLIRGLANEDRGQVRAAYADLRRASALDPEWAEPREQLKRFQVVRR